MKKTLDAGELLKKSRFGLADSGSAIVDCIWLTPIAPIGFIIGQVLLCSPEQEWRCYCGILPPMQASLPEAEGAKLIAATGAKVPVDMAIAAFPGQFYREDYV